MDKNFADACQRVLVHEGSKYTNDPHDPGGSTKYGVTLATWKEHGHPGATAADIERLTSTDAAQFYRDNFWQRLRCPQLPDGVDYALLDYAIHSGINRAPRVLQRLCNVSVDGAVGKETVDAATNRDPKVLVGAICDERIAFLKTLPNWTRNQNGWARRVSEVRSVAMLMAGRSQGVTPAPHIVTLPPGVLPWMARLNAIMGLYEFDGGADNPAILAMARYCGGKIAQSYKHDAIAWCALTGNYILKSSGFPGDDSLWALDFRNYGTKLKGPAVGAIATKTRDGGGHVFTVIGRTSSGALVGRGGNQSDMVCDALFDASVCQFNWPPGYPLPAKQSFLDLPVVSPLPHVKKNIVLPPPVAAAAPLSVSSVATGGLVTGGAAVALDTAGRAEPPAPDAKKVSAPVALAAEGGGSWSVWDWAMAHPIEGALLAGGSAVLIVVVIHLVIGWLHSRNKVAAVPGVVPVTA